MGIDMPPKAELWLPPKAAIIRSHRDMREASFPFPAFCPSKSLVMSFRGSAASASPTITAPGGIAAGDLIVLFDMSNLNTVIVPSGFTQLATSTFNFSGANVRAVLSGKVATGSEGGSSISGMTGAGQVAKVMSVFQCTGAAGMSPGTFNAQGTLGDPAGQTVSASGGATPLVVLGAYGTYNFFDNGIGTRGFSPGKDGEAQADYGSGDIWLAYKIYNAAPASVSIDMGDVSSGGGGQNLLSGWVSMT
jgi:hypothetical protein